MNNPIQIIRCDILNPVSDKSAELIRDGAAVIELTETGSTKPGYVFKETGSSEDIIKKYSSGSNTEIIDRSGKLLMPPFFDIHFHWVQDDVREMPKENLLNWLRDYVWPYESKFSDPEYSETKCAAFSEKLLSAGTLGGACYCSIHGHTVDHALKYFRGTFKVGNVLMTMNSPSYLTQDEADALDIVYEKSARYKEKYAVTPRFAPTTSPGVMKKCAGTAADNNSFIQSHLSETVNEINFVLSIYRDLEGFKDAGIYTEIYSRCGVLGPRTIMGHCIHVSDAELEILRETGTAIAHCPSSNAPVSEKGLGSGLFDFRKAEKAGVKWALGSDIGGGPYLSMFDVMRSFVHQNREKNIREASYTKALYRATAAGAEILGVGKSKGNIKKGKSADFILIDSPAYRENETAEDILRTVIEEKADKRDRYIDLVQSTFLDGREIFTRK